MPCMFVTSEGFFFSQLVLRLAGQVHGGYYQHCGVKDEPHVHYIFKVQP
ncbi:unnamed protein product [Choristocarpus tenellus]